MAPMPMGLPFSSRQRNVGCVRDYFVQYYEYRNRRIRYGKLLLAVTVLGDNPYNPSRYCPYECWAVRDRHLGCLRLAEGRS